MPIRDPNDSALSLVLSAVPEVQVYVTDLREIAISVIGVDSTMERVEHNIVHLPLDYAEQVGKHLLEIAAAAK